MSENKKLKKGISILKLAITILAILLLFLLFIQFQESNAEINII